MTPDLYQAIYSLFDCQGRNPDQPLTRESLCSTFNLDDRAMREAIVEVMRIYRLPIISSPNKKGYIVASTPQEIDEAVPHLMSYFLSFKRRIDLLNEIKAEMGQTKLFTKEERVQDYHQKIEGLKKVIGAQADLNLPQATGAAREGNMRSL